MRLMMGDAITARKHAAEAAQCLARVPFESPNDARLVTLLNACVEYEGGKAEPLARFLSLELDDFAHGEIWPSLIEFALQYGSQALSEHFSTIAARSFLDRWRIYQIRNRQFRAHDRDPRGGGPAERQPLAGSGRKAVDLAVAASPEPGCWRRPTS